MSIVSLRFLVFLLISVILYYIFPKKYRWITLLISSIVFFLCASGIKLIIYLLVGVISAYIGTNLMYKKSSKYKTSILFLTLLIIVGMLFILKYINIFPMTLNYFGKLFGINVNSKMIELVSPLGISYYTLSLIGYIIDIYRGAYEPQKNILKLLLFTSYYPVMISGPIVRYSDMEKELFKNEKLDYDNLYIGFSRIIYGLMKKLVIADQLSLIVRAIFDNYTTYSGYYIIIGIICYAVQIYMDFSGCMDIVIGSSKMYSITLMENFDSPFFSKTLSEFWRRWHISLGTWAKDYIMYPLLKSRPFQSLGNKCKKAFGKKIGKRIPTILAIFILWLLIGLWHGASFKYIFAAGILPWIYLTLSQIFEGLNQKIVEVFHIKTDVFSFKLFQVLRTLSLMCFIWLIVNSPSLLSFKSVIRNLFIIQDTTLFENLPNIPLFIVSIMLTFVISLDYLNYKGINIFEEFQKQNWAFRVIILIILIITILIYGAYGPGYNASDFIYGGF